MSAREDILSAIKARRGAVAARPAPYAPPPPGDRDLVHRFARMAMAAAADVQTLASPAEIPEAVGAILRARNMKAEIHIPDGAPFHALDWSRPAGLARLGTPPGPDDAALGHAPCAIAETGTLVFPAGADAPASWHFRCGLEIAVLKTSDIFPHMESVLARLGREGLPATLNFVTGPSRTADIEQTLELGAHGPKGLVILIVQDEAETR